MAGLRTLLVLCLGFYISGIAVSTSLLAQDTSWHTADSLIAYLYLIGHNNQPDSVKGAQIRAIFQQFQMDTTTYRQFYRHFMQLPPSQQLQRLQKAAELIRQWAYQRRTKHMPQTKPFSFPQTRAPNPGDTE